MPQERLSAYRRIRELGLSVSLAPTGHHRINFIGGKEATAYYAADLPEALAVAERMAAGESPPRAPRPTQRVPTRPADEATQAAAVGVLRAARTMLAAYDGVELPPWLRDEAAELARICKRYISVLLLSVLMLGLCSTDREHAAALAAEWAVERVAKAVDGVADAAGAALQKVGREMRPNSPITGPVEQTLSVASAAVEAVGAALETTPAEEAAKAEAQAPVEEPQAADPALEPGEEPEDEPEAAPPEEPPAPPDVAPRQLVAEGQPAAEQASLETANPLPSDEAR
ncbi:MAG: hypothetical protein A2882_07185 [Phenylobacterium sp. RIFCSPHIGHO2_01_FULL_70_10]|nr:MAG: hypothetical protein A2882_07185 [Phenylobacterium sp. RIFCSPHIGHO2_01_FULL_70_10]